MYKFQNIRLIIHRQIFTFLYTYLTIPTYNVIKKRTINTKLAETSAFV
jgi:hypothetical protein